MKCVWRRYKDEARYQSSPHPFPPRRMGLVDKLFSDLHSLLMVVGTIWLAVMVIGYLFF